MQISETSKHRRDISFIYHFYGRFITKRKLKEVSIYIKRELRSNIRGAL